MTHIEDGDVLTPVEAGRLLQVPPKTTVPDPYPISRAPLVPRSPLWGWRRPGILIESRLSPRHRPLADPPQRSRWRGRFDLRGAA